MAQRLQNPDSHNENGVLHFFMTVPEAESGVTGPVDKAKNRFRCVHCAFWVCLPVS